MAVMKAAQLVEKAKAVANSATVYKLGTFGNKTSNGKKQWDCSGLLKGILWGYPDDGKYQSNGVSDQNADTIISKCSGVSTNFSNIESGEVVWMKGHMGIYIGNGKVVEATPKWDNGVQITTCGNVASGSKSRKWTKHGKSPYIDYGSAAVAPTPQPTPQPSRNYDNWVSRLQTECNNQGYSSQTVDGIPGSKTLAGCPELGRKSKGNITRLAQERLNALGYNCGAVDGANGPKTQTAVKRFQAAHGLVQDGIIGTNTWRKLLGL